MENKKIIKIIMILFICFFFILTLVFNAKSSNDELLKTTKSMVTEQENIEYTINVDIPKRLNDKQREILKQFAELMGEEVQTKKKGFWNK